MSQKTSPRTDYLYRQDDEIEECEFDVLQAKYDQAKEEIEDLRNDIWHSMEREKRCAEERDRERESKKRYQLKYRKLEEREEQCNLPLSAYSKTSKHFVPILQRPKLLPPERPSCANVLR